MTDSGKQSSPWPLAVVSIVAMICFTALAIAKIVTTC